MVRTVKPKDVNEIKEIYNYYILNSIFTFSDTPVTLEEMSKKIKSIIPELPWIVYEIEGQILGYAYASRWKSRSAYKHTVETTVYLKPVELNKGIGTLLYSELIK